MTKNVVMVMTLGLLAAMLAGAAGAETLARFEFTEDTDADVLGTGIASATYDGSALFDSHVGDDGFGEVLQSYPKNATVDYSVYWSLTMTGDAGATFDVRSLIYEVGKGGSADPRGYAIRSSVDGFAADLKAEQLPTGAQQAPALTTLDLSGDSAFLGLDSVEFRFYVYTPGDPGSYSVDWRNVEVSSDAPTSGDPVPEPATLSLLGLGLAGMAVRRIRGRRA